MSQEDEADDMTMSDNEEHDEGDDDGEEESGADDQEIDNAADQQLDQTKGADNPLTADIARKCLAFLCKTGNGLAHAFVGFESSNKQLTDISALASYIHLRYVDLSSNSLTDLQPLVNLTHLMTLRVDLNPLKDLNLGTEMNYLQVLSARNCKIDSLEGIGHPLLKELNLSGNQILNFDDLPVDKLTRLETLELRSNKLTTLEGLRLPTLKHLYAAGNLLKNFDGIEGMENLVKVHLRENRIESLKGLTGKLQQLMYLNLRQNNLTDPKLVRPLRTSSQLKSLSLIDNPCTEIDIYRVEVLARLTSLKILDKEEFSEEDVAEANKLREELSAEDAEADLLESQMESNRNVENELKEKEQREDDEDMDEYENKDGGENLAKLSDKVSKPFGADDDDEEEDDDDRAMNDEAIARKTERLNDDDDVTDLIEAEQ